MKALSDTITHLVASDSPVALAARRKWSLTQEAFAKLLASFAEEPESAARIYLEICSNLIRFFEWRGCPFPEDHADETMNRVAKRLLEGEEIRNPSSYCIGVARFLLLEINKERLREQQALSEFTSTMITSYQLDESEAPMDCLRHCLQQLSADNRELILQYYLHEKGAKIESRKRLAERLNIPVNTLRMRALRIRENLQRCVENCQEQGKANCANRSFITLVATGKETNNRSHPSG
jgi:DNA-directed RNA polymerase specialized sigma24 family protein